MSVSICSAATDAHGRELVALLVEAHGDDPVRALAFHGESLVGKCR